MTNPSSQHQPTIEHVSEQLASHQKQFNATAVAATFAVTILSILGFSILSDIEDKALQRIDSAVTNQSVDATGGLNRRAEYSNQFVARGYVGRSAGQR